MEIIMFFRRFIDFFASNRFTRFLALILLAAPVIVVTSVFEIVSTNNSWTWHIEDGCLFLPALLILAVCLVGQLFGDIMNVETVFNNAFVTFLKRLIFFAVSLAAIFIGIAFVLASGDVVPEGINIMELGMNSAGAFAPVFAVLCYMFGYVRHSNTSHREDNKRILPLYFIISYAGSVVAGIVMAIIIKLTGAGQLGASLILGLTASALVVIAVVFCIKVGAWVFEEEFKSYSSGGYSSGYSGASSGGSSGGYSGYDDNERYHNCYYCIHHCNIRIDRNAGTSTYTNYENVDCCKLDGQEIYSVYSHNCPRYKRKF